jgi:hypothetical protein
MKWVDVAGPPGCGKSTLCYELWGDRSVKGDGLPPPASWRLFLDEITTLCTLVKDHASFQAVLRMNDRSAKKMAAVTRMDGANICGAGVTPAEILGKIEARGTFVQTGFVQRVLGFGWRLQDMGQDINLIRRALWLMPVSVGVVFLEADLETILQRNRDREKNPATRFENRSAQVPLMLPSIALAKEVLRERGVPVMDIDVQHQSIDDARAQLIAFADQEPCHVAQMGHCDQVAAYASVPPWWRQRP